jgi:SEC-C motif-containing protein
LTLDASTKWVGLTVLDFAEQGDTAEVEFEARFLRDGLVDALHERSRFVCEQGRWLYTDGNMRPSTFKSWRPGRNEFCPCGSGKKFKRCCGA